MTRALVYVRLSEYDGAEDLSLSPQGQEQACRDYANAKGWTVVDVVKDLDVSGSNRGLRLNRPGIRELVERFGTYDVVVFRSLDRLARNVVDFGTFAEQCQENGVAVVSVKDSLDLTTPGGKFTAQILAAFAEMEADMIGSRVASAWETARREGRFAGGFVPWGYKSAPNPNGPGKVLVVDQREAKIATEVAQRIVRGESLYAIGADLRERGVQGKRNGSMRWDATMVRRVATAPSIIGIRMKGKEPLLDHLGLPVKAWDPAIDPELHSQAVRVLDANLSKPGSVKRKKASRLLSGIIECPSCKRPLALKSVRGVAQYACASRSRGVDCERGVSARAEEAEVEVTRRFLDCVGSWRRLVDVTHEVAPDMDALRDVERALEDVGREYGLNGPSDALEARRAALVAMRDELSAVKVEGLTRETGKSIREEWNSGDLLVRQQLLREYVERVRVRPSPGGKWSNDRIIVDWSEHVTAQDGYSHTFIFPSGDVIVSGMDEGAWKLGG